MATRKDTGKKTTTRKTTTRRATSKKKTTKKKVAAPNVSDERFEKILGVVLLLASVFLGIAFFSYFYTWEYDQDIASTWDVLLDKEVKAKNSLGKLGAIISNGAFFWGFGVASIAIVVVLFKLGIDLVRKRPLKTAWRWMRLGLFVMVIVSIGLSIFTYESGFPWEGAFGKGVYGWLDGIIGRIGAVLLLAFTVIGALIWIFNPNLDEVKVPSTADIKLPKSDTLNNNTDVPKSRLSFKERLANLVPEVEEDVDLDIDDSRNNQKANSSSIAPAIDENGFDIVEENKDIDNNAVAVAAVTVGAVSAAVGDALDFDVPSVESKKDTSKSSSEPEMDIIAPTDSDSTEPLAHPFDIVSDEKSTDNTENNHPLDVNTQESTVPEQMTIDKETAQDDLEPYDPTKDLSSYVYPSLDALESHSADKIEINRDELEANKNQIIETLRNYKIEIVKIRATIGPTVTLYEIVPAPGVKISKIKNLEDDIALSLAALGIRIIAPIPGKGTIGIEVPNKNKQIVSLKEILDSEEFQNSKMALPIALGKTISNDIFIADLAKMPHLLIAGATGQGKSVGINTILMSLLYKKHPSQVKLVMVDPKKVELFPYSSLDKHFLGAIPDSKEPIITDTSKVVETLNSLCIEMDERYDLLKAARARNIKEYNKKFTERKLNPNNGHKFLPYIVLVIDEFADLMMTAGKEVEMPIARLAQLARAIGIHLIIATQRPSVNIITGIIKANFPARLAFKVTSKVDSRTILDAGGADQLIGRGDMLLSEGSDLVRIQCAFVDTPEVEKVIDHIAAQQGYGETYQLPEFRSDEDLGESAGNLKFTDLDEKLPEAARLIIGNQHGSTSSIQRGLQLGYNRAGRIMDQLESLGIVGPQKGSKPREVLYFSVDEFENYWENLQKNNQPRIS